MSLAWTPPLERLLLDSVVDEVRKVGGAEAGLKKQPWTVMLTAFNRGLILVDFDIRRVKLDVTKHFFTDVG